MEGTVSKRAIPASALGLALVLLATAPKANAEAAMISASAFGLCAHHSDLVVKIAACKEATRLTSYPWILHWVYRELARAQRDRGERDNALVSYARSLAAKDDKAVREEMEALGPLTQ
jgi:hypothetical protein